MREQTVAALVSDVDRARRRLYALLRSKDAFVLSTRPASGEWSIVENVRHLVFAEQAHLGKFLPDGFMWISVGLTQRSGRALRAGKAFTDVGTEPKEDLAEVFRVWDLIHQPIRQAVKGKGGDAHYALGRHLKHLQRHVEVIEKVLARGNKDA